MVHNFIVAMCVLFMLQAFVRMGIQPPRAVLLTGAPGTGKTMLARVVASACRANFINVSIPDVLRSAVGDSEKAIADVFKLAKACKCVPCLPFVFINITLHLMI